MTSMPACPAICASLTQSGQLPDQRSGTLVTARPDEQLAPKRPNFSRLVLPIAARRPFPISRSKVTLVGCSCRDHNTRKPLSVDTWVVETAAAGLNFG